MDMRTIEFKKEGTIRVITLNRPERMNAICDVFLNELDTVLKDLETDHNLGALIVTGAGKIFAAGADIKEIRSIDGVVGAHKFVIRVQQSFK